MQRRRTAVEAPSQTCSHKSCMQGAATPSLPKWHTRLNGARTQQIPIAFPAHASRFCNTGTRWTAPETVPRALVQRRPCGEPWDAPLLEQLGVAAGPGARQPWRHPVHRIRCCLKRPHRSALGCRSRQQAKYVKRACMHAQRRHSMSRVDCCNCHWPASTRYVDIVKARLAQA